MGLPSAKTEANRDPNALGSTLLRQPVIGQHALHAIQPHIVNYEPTKGFIVPKFTTYDGTSDLFNHITHYRELMTLDIGNDALMCKVFLANLHAQALSWFHSFPKNSMNNFWDLSEAFVGQYLCSAHHKQNISTLQNIKM